MTTWVDTQNPETVERILAKMREVQPDVLRHSNGDERFGLWLWVADKRATSSFGVGIFDIADWTWWDAYEGGMRPAEAVLGAFMADDTYGPMLEAMSDAED